VNMPKMFTDISICRSKKHKSLVTTQPIGSDKKLA
jgi:hypothetical protein